MAPAWHGTVRRAGHRVVEVNRGDRRTRRAAGKSDTIDAEVAARSVLAGQSTAIPKTADGAVEMIRQLKVARDTAVKGAHRGDDHLKQIIVQRRRPSCEKPSTTSPITALLTRCAGLRPGPLDTPDRVRQAHPPGARPPVDRPRRGNRDCTTGTSSDSRPRRHRRSVRGLRGRRPHRGRDVDPLRR